MTLQMNREEQINQMLDKQAITDLLYAYCNAADRHDNEKMRSLYHEDAVDDHGAFFKGAAMDFIDHLPDIQKNMQILHHNLTTINIALDGDYAEGEVYVLAFHQVMTEEGAIDVLIGGRYLDKYEKREGIWKFSYKAVLADWVKISEPSEVNLQHPFVQGSHIGTPGPKDPSYDTFRLLGFGKPFIR